ncbi:hypothetical protein E2542_SST09770 [Spatholobus suberectus]|nr:hypothetical protein E2542_SST09770 [Spatholobus suberectus]
MGMAMKLVALVVRVNVKLMIDDATYLAREDSLQRYLILSYTLHMSILMISSSYLKVPLVRVLVQLVTGRLYAFRNVNGFCINGRNGLGQAGMDRAWAWSNLSTDDFITNDVVLKQNTNFIGSDLYRTLIHHFAS